MLGSTSVPVATTSISVRRAQLVNQARFASASRARRTAPLLLAFWVAPLAAGCRWLSAPVASFGVISSSVRFKHNIKPMDKASEAILGLKPVTFRYKEEIDPDSIPQFGLVAEEVEKVNPDLVARDEDGKVMTVRYEAVNAMLLNECFEEHQKVEEQARKAQQQDGV